MDKILYILELSLTEKDFFMPNDVVLKKCYSDLQEFNSSKKRFISIRDSLISLGYNSVVHSTIISRL